MMPNGTSPETQCIIVHHVGSVLWTREGCSCKSTPCSTARHSSRSATLSSQKGSDIISSSELCISALNFFQQV